MRSPDVAPPGAPPVGPVVIGVDNVWQHMDQYPRRWPLLPLLGTIIENTYVVRGRRHGPGDKVAFTRLWIANAARPGYRYFETRAHQSAKGTRYWQTTFPIEATPGPAGKGETVRQKVVRRGTAAGPVLWTDPTGTRFRNPRPARRHDARSWPGPASVAHRQSGPPVKAGSRREVALLFGLLFVAAYAVDRLAPTPQQAA